MAIRQPRYLPGWPAILIIPIAGLVLAATASCTPTRTAAHAHASPTPSARPTASIVSHSRTVRARAGKYAVTLVPVSASGLGCTQTARVVGYPVPCPTMLPPVVLGVYQGCLSAHQTHNWFMSAWVRGCGSPPDGWRGWMIASGGNAVFGTGQTVADDQHFVMEALPFRTANYNLIADGAGWYSMGRPRTVRVLGSITLGGRHMGWVMVPPDTPIGAMGGHLALIWTTRSHTYALSFHILPPGGEPMARALDIAVAQHLVMVRPQATRNP